jgi:hypothetical protein
MKPLDQILDELQRRDDCDFASATRLPALPSGLLLPADLLTFYRRFGGGRMFGQPSDPRYRISSPEDFVEIGMAIYGEPMGRPPQDSWYSLADVQDGNYIAIDCHPARLGLCYDIFHETASDLGNCRIIARSFSEFLQRAALSGDDAWWLGDRFEMYGYADDQSQP